MIIFVLILLIFLALIFIGLVKKNKNLWIIGLILLVLLIIGYFLLQSYLANQFSDVSLLLPSQMR